VVVQVPGTVFPEGLLRLDQRSTPAVHTATSRQASLANIRPHMGDVHNSLHARMAAGMHPILRRVRILQIIRCLHLQSRGAPPVAAASLNAFTDIDMRPQQPYAGGDASGKDPGCRRRL